MSPPTHRREDDNRTEAEITEEYLDDQFKNQDSNIIDPTSDREPEAEGMDTDIPTNNILSNQDIHIRRVPLSVWLTNKGKNLTKTVNTVLESNQGMNLERYFRN